MEKRRLPDTPFWVEPESVRQGRLTLNPEESHHLLHVHRGQIGTPFDATDGQGNFYTCAIHAVERRAVIGTIVSRAADVGELPAAIHVIVGIPDWGAIEQVVAHGVPLGVSVFDFAPCERSGRAALGPQRLERLERIARAGLKQSRRSRLPLVRSSKSLQESVTRLEEGCVRLVAHPEPESEEKASSEMSDHATALAIGPPGGFSDKEYEFLRGQGFSPISLGPSRLTTETATIALISLTRNSLLTANLRSN